MGSQLWIQKVLGAAYRKSRKPHHWRGSLWGKCVSACVWCSCVASLCCSPPPPGWQEGHRPGSPECLLPLPIPALGPSHPITRLTCPLCRDCVTRHHSNLVAKIPGVSRTVAGGFCLARFSVWKGKLLFVHTALRSSPEPRTGGCCLENKWLAGDVSVGVAILTDLDNYHQIW